MKLKLDCKDVSRLISDGQDLALPAAERARMRLHFVVCETCRNVNEQFDFLRRAMRQIDRSKETDEPPKR
ncbi:MAG: zf-HC2 domain-containing protein [Burkholderiaceae bacterium]